MLQEKPVSTASARTVLLVHAHPEPTSLTAHLARFARDTLRAQGHRVLQSDLYQMQWKAAFDAQDFPDRQNPDRLSFIAESRHAFASNSQTADVDAEQHKILQADAVVLLFPLWWFGMPAIMKGWVDRVWAYGLAYGYRDAGNTYRYGEGGFAGKRALLAVAVGGPEIDYAPRGINGPPISCCSRSRTARCSFPACRYCPPSRFMEQAASIPPTLLTSRTAGANACSGFSQTSRLPSAHRMAATTQTGTCWQIGLRQARPD